MSYVIISEMDGVSQEKQTVSSLSLARAHLELDATRAKFLPTKLYHDKSFILERRDDFKNTDGVRDFSRVIVQVIDRSFGGFTLGGGSIDDLQREVNNWASYADTPGARGNRLALVSKPGMSDLIYTPDGRVAILYFEVWLSTATVFNYRRATLNHSRDKWEFAKDLQRLFANLDLGYDIMVEHEYFGVFELGNTKLE